MYEAPNYQPREDAAQMDDDDDYQVVDDTRDQHLQAPVQQPPQQDPQPQQETPDEGVQLQESAPEKPRIGSLRLPHMHRDHH